MWSMTYAVSIPIANGPQNSFNVSMEPTAGHDLVKQSTCTSCQFTEDFSNYWTAVLFFRAKNGTYKRVPQIYQQGMEGTNGGMVSLLQFQGLMSAV